MSMSDSRTRSAVTSDDNFGDESNVSPKRKFHAAISEASASEETPARSTGTIAYI